MQIGVNTAGMGASHSGRQEAIPSVRMSVADLCGL